MSPPPDGTSIGRTLIDRTRVDLRCERIEELCGDLQRARDLPVGPFLAEPDLVPATERRLQVAVQAAIDVAAHVAAAQGWRVPEGYAATFDVLAQRGVLPPDLAGRMRKAAGLRNALVHDYLDIDPARLHASLTGDLDDLRAFVTAVVRFVATVP